MQTVRELVDADVKPHLEHCRSFVRELMDEVAAVLGRFDEAQHFTAVCPENAAKRYTYCQ